MQFQFYMNSSSGRYVVAWRSLCHFAWNSWCTAQSNTLARRNNLRISADDGGTGDKNIALGGLLCAFGLLRHSID